MEKSIYQGFNEFHDNLKFSVTETLATQSHRESIKSCLENNFTLDRFVRIGSFGNGTNICGHSDVDYLASLSPLNFTQTSDAMLNKVKNSLLNRFPNTNIYIDNPAITCPFGTSKSEDTEIVVAKYVRDFTYDTTTFKVYEISNSQGGWMEICPDVHNYYVRKIDNQLSNKVKPLIRFIKAWKFYKKIPISSFYLEMFVTKYASSEQSILYYIDIYRILKNLNRSGLADLNDPTGFSSRISACKTNSLKMEALNKLPNAVARSELANDSIMDNKIKDGFYYFNKLYDDKFSKYN